MRARLGDFKSDSLQVEFCDDLHRTTRTNLYFSIFLFNYDTVQSLSFSNINLINDNINKWIDQVNYYPIFIDA